MTLHELADELLEIRRYVRSHPVHVEKELGKLETVIHDDVDPAIPPAWAKRLEINMHVGRMKIVVDPEILEGYLYGAAAEIREMAIKQEDAK